MTTDQVQSDDERTLNELGYAQTLKRRLSSFSNFAVSFSIISVLSGCITTYYLAMDNGGPLVMTVGWLVVGAFVTLVALSMAEICSVYPTAGGLYYWAARLARRNKRQWAWVVGWFNFLGEVAVTAAIDYGAAITMAAFLNLTVGYEVTLASTFWLFLAIIVAHGLLNTFGVNVVRILSSVSAWWHLVGVAIIVAILAIVPETHQSVGWTLFHVESGVWDTALGAGAPFYAVLIGLLLAQYTFTGFDASAHIAEETVDAARSAPRGIVTSVLVSLVAGFVLLYAITASIVDYAAQRGTDTGLPVAQIFVDAAGSNLGQTMLFIALIAQLFCGMASVTANSRMTYAFSRDDALPGSSIWKKVNPRTGTPTNSIWLCVAVSIVLTIPAFFNAIAFFAVTSIAVIGLYIAYGLPTLLRLTNPSFTPGVWNLGKWSKPIGWVAVAWVAFIVVLFMLPAYPVVGSDWTTYNYAPLAVLVAVGIAAVTWFAGGRRRFLLEHTDDAHPVGVSDNVTE